MAERVSVFILEAYETLKVSSAFCRFFAAALRKFFPCPLTHNFSRVSALFPRPSLKTPNDHPPKKEGVKRVRIGVRAPGSRPGIEKRGV